MKYIPIDVESYPDNAGLTLKLDGEYLVFTTCPADVTGLPLAEFKPWFDAHEFDGIFCTINGQAYDNFMLAAMLGGEHDPAKLKILSDAIIDCQDRTYWRGRIRNEFHCDLLAMHGGFENVAGSKELAIKGNLRHIGESPVSFDQAVTTPAERRDIYLVYNRFDVDTIEWVAAHSRKEINNRWTLQETDGIDVLSQPDAGVSDQHMRKLLYGTGYVSYPRDMNFRLQLAPLVDKFVFEQAESRALAERLRAVDMDFSVANVVEKGQPKKKLVGPTLRETLKLGGNVYRFGKGGLHSDDGPGFFVAGHGYRILNCDFPSYYPHLILIHELCPRHVVKRPFLTALRGLLARRLQAKADGDETLADALKVSLNSIFGKAGSPYSCWFDPTALISCTLLGQLTLIYMIDLITTLNNDLVQVLSANTDSLTLRVREHEADEMMKLVNVMAADRGHPDMGWAEYSRIVRRDISNYVAFGLDGQIKTAKGAYAYRADKIRGKATNQIVIDSVQAYFRDDMAIADTVRACQDVRKFIDYRKTQKTHVIADEFGGTHGSIQRWVIVTTAEGLHLDAMRRSDGQRTQIVSHGALLLPDLPERLPADIDYEHYIRLAESLVDDILNPQIRVSHVIPIGELNSAQRQRFAANASDMTSDPARLAVTDIDKLAADYAGIYKGNSRSSMRGCLLRAWERGHGVLTHGDLLAVAVALDAPVGYFSGSKARNLEQMVEWIATDVSPIPKPRSTLDCATLALAWAADHVEPVKRRRRMRHTDAVIGSTYLNAEALRHFATTGNEYRLACKIAAASVKHDAETIAAELIVRIIGDARAYVDQHPDLAKPRTELQAMRDQDRWDYYSNLL